LTADRNHHVVPKAYLRGFAQDDRVRLVYKYGNRPPEKIKHIKKSLVERGFLTVDTDSLRSDELEDAFARAECQIFARTHLISYPDVSPEQAEAIKALGALLFARSYRIRQHSPRISREAIEERKMLAPRDRGLVQRFTREKGRPPAPGELARMIEDFGDEFLSSGLALVTGILDVYRKAVAKFAPLHVSLYDARGLRHGLTTGDNPVVLARGAGMRDVDNDRRVIAIGDADTIYFPLNRWTGVCLTGQPEGHGRLGQREVLMMNNAMWRSAHRVVVAHPAEDWPSACSVSRDRPPSPTDF
jgi:hypothetical protein